ncbi:MAG: superoxide dismutase family protein [Imperialibacter sp.]|uniref:superoxide dismutase family protein n=1 Tax=Imperialibacter sp. TaxID=2038411 RepID=UPI0032EB4339
MNTKSKILFYTTCNILTMGLLLGMPSCEQKSKPLEAVGELSPTEGNQVKGTVTFTETADGVKVVADLTGLEPGKHGFHIHEFGDCSAPDGTSAGGHFNPDNAPHASLTDANRHAGDMGNIVADASGNAHIEFTDKMLMLSGEKSIVDKGLIVHKNMDDLKTQPTGNAGPREACGTIVLRK